MLIREGNQGDRHWTASCDECKALFLHKDYHTVVKAPFPDKLVELMRKRGWTTERRREPGAPLKWVCPSCLQKKERKSA